VNQKTGQVVIDGEHPLIMIAAHMISAQRSSKKRMAYYFEKLRNQAGWSVEVVERAEPTKGNAEKGAKRSIADRRVHNILNAKNIDVSDYLDLAMKVDRGEVVSEAAKWQYERARLHYSYKSEVTEALIQQDDGGRLSKQIEDYKFLRRQLRANYEIPQSILSTSLNSQKLTRGKNPISLLATILESAELVDGTALSVDASVNNLTLKSFTQLCKKNSVLIEESLRIELRDDLKQNPIRQLNAFLKIVGLKLSGKKRSKSKGKNLRFYGIDASSIKLMEDLSERFVSRDALKGRGR
jgi:hypothetical protein